MQRKKRIGDDTSVEGIVPSALAALKALDNTTGKNDLPYNNVPTELLIGPNLDLSKWTLVATDKCLGNLGKSKERLVVLNLSGAETITDGGLKLLSDCTSTLVSLNLDNAYRITSFGSINISSVQGETIHEESAVGYRQAETSIEKEYWVDHSH